MPISLPRLARSHPDAFRTQEGVRPLIEEACAAHDDLAAFHDLGRSEEGRSLFGVVLGKGPQTVSLIAGNHADEPVGPETLRTLILAGLERWGDLTHLLSRFRFVIVPHTNPDGEARNQSWIDQWPDVEAYLKSADREPPGRDLEFGFPAMRPENEAVSDFLRAHAPFALHMSLHGMGFSEGAMLLIERHWTFRTQPLRDGFAQAARLAGLSLHDHNRKGEKGFFYVEPGFTTTPEGAAMRAFFQARGDEAMAARFHDSSMEFARALGGDPLCLVTELPLFVVPPRTSAPPGVPAAYLALKGELPALRQQLEAGESVRSDLDVLDVRPLSVETALQLQLRALELGLAAAADEP